MNKTFRSGQSLHRLIEDAPIENLLPFLTAEGAAKNSAEPCAILECRAKQTDTDRRQVLIERFGSLDEEIAAPLDHAASRVGTLGSGRGADALERIVRRQLPALSQQDYDAQLDGLGRSIWCFVHQRRVFDDAESYHYAVHYRTFGKWYNAYEVTDPLEASFEWTEAVEAALQSRIGAELDLRHCGVTHLLVKENGSNAASHLIIVRHAGPLASVAVHRDDGRKDQHYYRPPNEATLIYLPDQGVVEVCADSPAKREDIARCFAEVGLGHDLSKKPLTSREYDLSRFHDSLSLPLFEPDGFSVNAVDVIEVDVRPGQAWHKLSLKVGHGDDIEAVAEGLFGSRDLLRRAAVILRVVVSVSYWLDEPKKWKAFSFVLSYPNGCNLRSNPDPRERQLGYELLEQWGILRVLRTPTSHDLRDLFPSLLDLYDLDRTSISAHEIERRGLDVARLCSHGILKAHGRHEVVLFEDEDGRSEEAEVRPSQPGFVEVDDPKGRAMWMPQGLVAKYRLRREWVEEMLLKEIGSSLTIKATSRPIDHLTYLGEMEIGGERVPSYLACSLHDTKVLRNIDIYLRGASQRGVGLVVAAGRDAPLCLGANVVVPLHDYLAPEHADQMLSVDALGAAYRENRQRALGGMVVQLIKKGHTATLFIPGKPPYTMGGSNQIMIFEQLVAAHNASNPAVMTSVLLEGTSVASPSQAFRAKDWASIKDVYIGQGEKRGSWQLIV